MVATLVAVEAASPIFDDIYTFTTTTSALSGDVICLAHYAQFDGGVGMTTPTSPSGSWTSRILASEPTWEPAIRVWTRPAPVGTTTITIPAVAAYHVGVVCLLRDVDEVPEDIDESFGDSQSGHITPSVDASVNSQVIRGLVTRGGTDSAGPNRYVWPTSTEQYEAAAGSGAGGGVFTLASRAATSAGAQGTETCTGNAVSNWGEYIGFTVAFKTSTAVATPSGKFFQFFH